MGEFGAARESLTTKDTKYHEGEPHKGSPSRYFVSFVVKVSVFVTIGVLLV